jgi:malate synthase
VLAELPEKFGKILSIEALAFVEALVREFAPEIEALLARRVARQQEIDAGKLLDFLPETAIVRDAAWSVAPAPDDLHDRRVEVNGPLDRRTIIDALNSGAKVFMADLEDATSPTWDNVVAGQVNLRDAVRRTLTHTDREGRRDALADEVAVLMLCPRGLHHVEKHVHLDGKPIPAALFDFGLYLFHNGRELLRRGSGPYYYLAKLESHLEARMWNDVFLWAQDELGIPRGSIRATVLIENVAAAFEMDEILYELRDHSAGLNCGRFDYICSIINKFHSRPEFVLPDRAQMSMTTHCMRSYSLLAVQTCHRRGTHAIGGLAAQIPTENDLEANETALQSVRDDKVREAIDGHDGTWVAHPGLVKVARQAFDETMPQPNQIHRKREEVHITATDLLDVPEGEITEAGLRHNIDIAVQYMEAWLGGKGYVPIYDFLEDAATAELSRSQIWQWLRHDNAVLADGRPIDRALCSTLFDEELRRIERLIGTERFESGKFRLARKLIEQIVTDDEFTDFMTLVAYEHLD